ncbi:MAG TPA: hypothetical protein VGI88_09400 [Verrucomicrobiae bacterium]|jgi:hypothetical protein
MSIFSKLFGARPKKRDEASAGDIPKVISQLQQSAQDGNFVVFFFVPPDSKDSEPVNLQYSIEGGVVGFDWVLIGPRNVADKMRVTDYALSRGYRLEERNENGCRFLRMTGNGISELGAGIIHEVYKIDRDTKLELMPQGFEWQP